MKIQLLTPALRDGAGGGCNFSCDDKLRIARRLDAFGVDYIEGGWPGSNPKDMEFFPSTRRNDPQPCQGDSLRLHLPGRH
ncbi:MAG: hypothetical protein R3A10_23305 [Caldilineaceae bacterium]